MHTQKLWQKPSERALSDFCPVSHSAKYLYEDLQALLQTSTTHRAEVEKQQWYLTDWQQEQSLTIKTLGHSSTFFSTHSLER